MVRYKRLIGFFLLYQGTQIIVNTFVREVILYEDKIIITYYFTDTIEPHDITPETITETEGAVAFKHNRIKMGGDV